MKVNKNDKIEVRIPKHLYESLKKKVDEAKKKKDEKNKKKMQETKKSGKSAPFTKGVKSLKEEKTILNEFVLSSIVSSLAVPALISLLGIIIAKLKKNEATKALADKLQKDVSQLSPAEKQQAHQNAANQVSSAGQRGAGL